MTPEQIQKISALGYIVVNHGQHVEDANKNIVMTRNNDGTYTTDIPKLNEIVQEVKLVRARNEKGHYIADDPNTPENEAWVIKTVKKVLKKK